MLKCVSCANYIWIWKLVQSFPLCNILIRFKKCSYNGWVTFKWKALNFNTGKANWPQLCMVQLLGQHINSTFPSFMSRGEDWHQASPGGIAAKNNPHLKLIKADLSKAWPCTISTCLVLLVGEVNPQHAHSLKYKLYRGQQVVQHCRLWVDSSCYWNMQLHGENVLWLLSVP